MTTIDLPDDVAKKLLCAANASNKTVSEYFIFLMSGDKHRNNAVCCASEGVPQTHIDHDNEPVSKDVIFHH